MDIIKNKTKRAIIAGDFTLIPGRALQVKDLKAITAKFPRLAELMAKGDVAKVEEAALEEEQESPVISRRKRG